MKKSIIVLVIIGLFFMFSVPMAIAGGDHHGSSGKASITIKTQTGTELNARTQRWCGGAFSTMSGYQAGQVSGKASGSGVSGSGGYDTGYSQNQNIPGGSQSMWGEQWGSVKINSQHR